MTETDTRGNTLCRFLHAGRHRSPVALSELARPIPCGTGLAEAFPDVAADIAARRGRSTCLEVDGGS
jgi:hypothetical protein